MSYDTFLIKHLSGQHDQATHGRRFASSSDPSSGYSIELHQKLGRQALKEWNITPEQKEAIFQYTKGNYRAINRNLRNTEDEILPDSMVKDIKKNTSLIQNALLNNVLKEPIIVHRGVAYDEGGKILESFKQAQRKKSSFVDNGFVSTSINPEKSFGGSDVELQIHLPKGMQGAYLYSHSNIKTEQEYLLPHGTAFRVKNISIGSYGQHVVTLEAATHGKSKKHLPGQHDQATHGRRFKIPGDEASKVVAGPKIKKPKVEKPKKEVISSVPDYSTIDIRGLRKVLIKDQENWNPTDNEKSILSGYTRIACYKMNKALRDEKSQGDEVAKNISTLQSCLLRNKTNTSFTVHRGIDGKHDLLPVFKNAVGKTYQDKGFVSTTTREKTAFASDLKMHIQVPKGMQGAYIDQYSFVSGENEFLFPHGTKFKVNQVLEKDGIHHVFLQAQPHKSSGKYIDGFLIKKIVFN